MAITLSMLVGIAGCAQQENVILLEVVSPEDVSTLTITVVPLDGRGSPSSAPRPVNQTAEEIRETPLHVAIRLDGPRDVMVVLSAPGAAGGDPLVAQRCFAVNGVARDSVWLVPLGSSEDADGDGFPRRAAATCARPSEDRTTAVACPGADPVLCEGMGEIDCDDDDEDRQPGAIEMCDDLVDQDCDGEDAPCEDADGDGFSGCRPGAVCTTDDQCGDQTCVGGRCTVDPTTCDCNDGDGEAYPGAPDPCMDAADTDCDGQNDLCDADCDGFPASPGGPDAPYFDCNDDDAATHPNETLRGFYGLADGDRLANGCDAVPATTAASDMCMPGPGGEPVGDEQDQDCNGFIDDGPGCTDTTDRDRDGSRACVGGATSGCDLNDCDPGIAPSRAEICGNAFDEDGDGTAQPCVANDDDSDGHIATAAGGDDCNDADPQVFTGAPENCLTPESESCTENLPCTSFGGDADMDGYLAGLPAGARGDCEDRVSFTMGMTMLRGADIYPFADEDPCDGIDNDCDGVVDEVLRAPDASEGAADGCVRTGGGATDVDYHLSAQHSEYCGGCGVVTAANQDCCTGVPTAVDQPTSCGECGYDCGAHTECPRTGTGAGGDVFSCACAPDATGDWADCDDSLIGASGGNGCEIDLDTDELHCGACNNRCGMNQTCIGGSCQCNAPYLDCDGMQATGCEINGSNDVNNCNACGTRCTFASGSPVCSGGTCSLGGCDPGFDNCNGNQADGCEQRLDILGFCGRCGESCGGTMNAAEICNTTSRTCDYTSCDPQFLDCGGGRVNGCEVPFSTSNCGGCGNVCGPNERCATAGDCQCGTGPSAATGEACTGATPDCCAGSNACVNLSNDVNNCGGCGVRCGPSETCVSGTCRCGGTSSGVGGGEACAGAGNECCGSSCVAVATAAANCGVCGNVCGPSEACVSGRCTCGGTTAPSTGEACAGTGNECCGGSCTDIRSTVASCGMCGRNCATIALNAAETCSMSTCNYSSCDANYLDCDSNRGNGCEVDGRTLANCGACGNNCSTAVSNAAETCMGGACNYSSCDPNFFDCDSMRGNGCEIDGRLLPNCGGCGNTCGGIQNATATCLSASCNYSSCNAGYGDCDSMRGNGCETNTQTALGDCGDCMTDCNATLQNTQAGGRTCTAGNCDYGACSSNFDNCDGNRENGCEASITTLMRCGDCTTNCNTTLQNTVAGGRVCSSGNCDYGACSAGFDNCDGNRENGCEASVTALTRCGNCTTDCTMTLQNVQSTGRTCSSGDCDYAMCAAGFGDCDSNRQNGCERMLGTTSNCGSCGHACGAGESCNAMGQCECGMTTSPTGEACPGASLCTAGACVP